MSAYWKFKVVQDGLDVASGDCPDLATVVREAAHYGMMYGQDGPCEAFIKMPDTRTWLKLLLAPQNPAREGVLDAEPPLITPEIHKEEGL